MLYNPRKRAVTPERIAQAVSEYYGVDLEALKGQKRDRAIVVPRQIAMYLMRAETEVSLLRIGAELGGRDHSTVLHACDKIDREMQENEDLRRELAAVRELIYTELSVSGVDRGLIDRLMSCRVVPRGSRGARGACGRRYVRRSRSRVSRPSTARPRTVRLAPGPRLIPCPRPWWPQPS